MPTNTYDALLTETVVGSPVSSISLNLSGISGYTDLVLQCSVRTDTSTFNNMNFPSLRFNGDSTSGLYSVTNLYTRNTGGGNAAASGRSSSQNEINLGGVATSAMATGIFSSYQINLQNYANTSVFKTVLARIGTGGNITALDGVWASVGLWRNTNAITSISLTPSSSGSFQVGSTFSLYGIRAEGVSPAPKATGGVISSDSTYYYHTFPATGVFTPTQTISCDYFMVAGGGGAGATTGGGWAGGGGGAGGYRTFTSTSFTATNYTITVGAGGNGGSGSGGTGGKGGNSSVIGGVISTTTTGGGGGGTTEVNGSTKTNGQPGGSGGGGAQTMSSVAGGAGNEGGYSPVEGYAGRSTTNNPGQGGGAGGVGLDSVYGTVPTPNGITAFNNNYYASGGYCLNVATGSQNGLAFTGNGGSSRNDGTGANVTGGNGGSGIVVIRYAKA